MKTYQIQFYKQELYTEFIFIIAGLSALVEFLNKPKYSTIIYVLQGQGSKDFGYCEMSQQLKNAFNKTVIFWPCPKMKVSTTQKFFFLKFSFFSQI